MNEKFSFWYSPMIIGDKKDTIQLRWAGIEKVISKFDLAIMNELINIVFDKNHRQEEVFNSITGCFKETDSTFSDIGNEEEIKILAGSILAQIISTSEKNLRLVSLAILTTAFCNYYLPTLKFDLIKMAKERILKDGADLRKRPQLSCVGNLSSKKYFGEDINNDIAEQNQPKLVSAIQSIDKGIQKFQKDINEDIIKNINALIETLIVQDEELQYLWWLTSQQSIIWDADIKKYPLKAKGLLIGYEAARLSSLTIEPMSLNVILAKFFENKESEMVSITEAINECDIEKLGKMVVQDDIALRQDSIFPLSYTIKRSLETPDRTAWVGAWSSIMKIKSDQKFKQIDIAIQIYREQMLYKIVKDWKR